VKIKNILPRSFLNKIECIANIAGFLLIATNKDFPMKILSVMQA
jgi:hypothetical protein